MVKISLLTHDLSTNCLGRAHVLGRLLAPVHDVEIVGPASTGEIWEPLRDDDAVPLRRIPAGRPAQMALHADGDVLYAVKERAGSLGVALAARRQRPRPLIVDCDDWEMGFWYDDVQAMVRSKFRDQTKWVARTLTDLRSPVSPYRTLLAERRVRQADAVTVSSRWLAQRFNGAVIVHSRDTRALDPALIDRDAVRAELGISPDATALLFMGSPRRHKGLQAIWAALELLDRDDIVFVHVGGDPGLPAHPRLRRFGVQPFAEAAKFLAAADIVALPQEDSPAARGQMPAKVYDAMAMGRALVVSDVSDLACTVDGCGLVVPPGDAAALAAAIGRLADDPALRARLGSAARARCIAEFSEDAVRPRLLEVVDRVADAHRHRPSPPSRMAGLRRTPTVSRSAAPRVGA
jgi:glycosyltransferase involved in cell wall biosynthesis